MAVVIGGRIYVIGKSDFDDYVWKKAMVVFNTETQKWEEPGIIKADIELRDTYYHGCVVMVSCTRGIPITALFTIQRKINGKEKRC
ncbi:unnamed protein product [Thlaspi arvense]|uniref:Uncharacterized protein n=1 Tax=Thlaspi arvense TaxID=13288 RepID=A0AAU9SD57_THLAR|nr:unnamed protein product [Thlaspi arvense]